ncbi:MAG: flagellar hook-basal body complex subunit FliE [Clostridia bacterium]|nr:flagellar hook-basal body complex subunit FliE [Clostridia bacterium]
MAITVNGINNNIIEQIQNIIKTQDTEKSSEAYMSFEKILNNAIENVNKTDLATQQDIIKIATGEANDLHTITINATKAELAVEMLVQVRNKAMEAYNEIMRISL